MFCIENSSYFSKSSTNKNGKEVVNTFYEEKQSYSMHGKHMDVHVHLCYISTLDQSNVKFNLVGGS